MAADAPPEPVAETSAQAPTAQPGLQPTEPPPHNASGPVVALDISIEVGAQEAAGRRPLEEANRTASAISLSSSESLTSGPPPRVMSTLYRTQDLERKICGVAVRWWLAVSLEVLSLVTAVGAGMTVKFFPLFFRVDYHFTPLEVCLLSFVYPVSIAGMVRVCRKVAEAIGRLQAGVLFHFLAAASLWGMSYCRSLYLVIPLYLLRGAFMTSRIPIIRAVILDLVPTDKRGRWNSFSSIRIFSWSGSAALGGLIADAAGGDYRATFVVTAGLHTCTAVLTSLLLSIYPKEQGGQRQPTSFSTVSRRLSQWSSTLHRQAVTPAA